MTGDFTLTPWLSFFPGEPNFSPTPSPVHPAPAQPKSVRHPNPNLPYEPPFIPFNGKINAQVKNLSLDAILDAVSDPPFQRLGFDTRVNGPIKATFTEGYTSTTVVDAQARLFDPTGHPLQGEIPASGVLDHHLHTQRRLRRTAQAPRPTPVQPTSRPPVFSASTP